MSTTLTDVIWQPKGAYLNCRVADFMKKHGISDWKELIKRSTDDTEWFWQAALEYMGFQWSKPYSKLLDTSKGFEWAKWFVDGELNIVSNTLDWHMEAGKKAGSRVSVGKDHVALIWEGEEQGKGRKLTYGELNELAGKIAAYMQKQGVVAGDAIGIYMPMVPEVVALLFACLKIGAVAVPVFSGYGAQALAARLQSSEAKLLFTADAGKRRGKLIDIKGDADIAAEQSPSVKQVVVLKHCANEVKWNARDVWFHEVVNPCTPVETVANLPAEHPSMYLYTSGTTGKPKGTVHTHAGALAQIAKELGFAFDVQPDDTFFWVTDIGWMMGPWEMIGVTFWGGTMVIFEGAPNYPTPDRVWQIVEQHNVTTLGVSPTAIRVIRADGDEWVDKHNMS
ncbi:MAG TPA: AMP-binding protein, partial [Chroococcales cyanobacterium]